MGCCARRCRPVQAPAGEQGHHPNHCAPATPPVQSPLSACAQWWPPPSSAGSFTRCGSGACVCVRGEGAAACRCAVGAAPGIARNAGCNASSPTLLSFDTPPLPHPTFTPIHLHPAGPSCCPGPGGWPWAPAWPLAWWPPRQGPAPLPALRLGWLAHFPACLCVCVCVWCQGAGGGEMAWGPSWGPLLRRALHNRVPPGQAGRRLYRPPRLPSCPLTLHPVHPCAALVLQAAGWLSQAAAQDAAGGRRRSEEAAVIGGEGGVAIRLPRHLDRPTFDAPRQLTSSPCTGHLAFPRPGIVHTFWRAAPAACPYRTMPLARAPEL